MNARDRAIIDSLSKFRCMSRADITDLHFSGLRGAVKRSNEVLKRLTRDGLISVSKRERMYIYFPAKSIKHNSQKIEHYLAIVRFYLEVRKIQEPDRFEVEPRYGKKGTIEPDIEMVWFGRPFFVEVQRHGFDKSKSFNLYEEYYMTEDWHELPWQNKSNPRFPYVWIYGVGKYEIEKSENIRFYHADILSMIGRIEKQSVKVGR